MLHIIEHSLLDTIKLVPFLFLTYLAMEYLEHKAGEKTTNMVSRAGKWGPLIGGVAGVVPQCGFSAAASNLYAGRVISLGTLFAIYLSTSDEMLPIMISERAPMSRIGLILAMKAVIGVVAGFVIDWVMQGRELHRAFGEPIDGHEAHGAERGHGHDGHCEAEHVHIHDEHHKAEHMHGHNGHHEAEHMHGHNGHHETEHVHGHNGHHETEHTHGHGGHHEAEHVHEHEGHHASEHTHHHNEHYHIHEICEHDHCNCEEDGVFLSAVKHTLQITLFVLLLTFALNVVLHLVGEDVLASMLSDKPVLGPVLAGIVGLVPNCASSIAITQLFLTGVIGMGSLMAGLLVNAGVGLVVLFRVNRHRGENLKIAGLLYIIGVVVGIVIEFLM